MLPLTDAARLWLLGLARQALEAASRSQDLKAPEPPPALPASDRAELARPRAAFVTLSKRGDLRGCVGRVLPDTALAPLVIEMAQAAARQDARFQPVTPDEVPQIQLEISVLSPFFPIQPDQIVPGTHGLAIRRGLYHGILLPQVATERHWNATQFLEQTCRKAGLPKDAWRRGATVEAFTADIIAEPDQRADGAPR